MRDGIRHFNYNFYKKDVLENFRTLKKTLKKKINILKHENIYTYIIPFEI